MKQNILKHDHPKSIEYAPTSPNRTVKVRRLRTFGTMLRNALLPAQTVSYNRYVKRHICNKYNMNVCFCIHIK
jgi:hypothetical protein